MIEHIQMGDISPRIQYAGTGAQVTFTFPFPIFAATDLQVFVDGTLKATVTDYSVTGAGQSTGGTVTFTAAPADGTVVTLRRKLAVQRTTDFQESGDFRAKTINDELDREVAFIQQIADEVGRTLRLADSDVPATLTLPAKGLRAGKALGFDANGDVAVSGLDMNQIETDAANAASAAATAAANASQAADSAATAATAAASATQSAAEAELYAQQAQSGDGKDLKVSADDTTAGFLADKFLASGLASLTTQNGGGDETCTLDVPVASQAEAEAGTDNGVALTPLRGTDLLLAWLSANLPAASQAEMEAGTETGLRRMSPAGIGQAIAALAGGGGIAMSTQTFTSSGTYTKPSGLLYALVFVTGSGGGGGLNLGWAGAGGGAGGTAIKLIAAASLGATETVTIGNNPDAGAGGTSSFGTHCSATGGTATNGQTGGYGGNGVGGDINLKGGGGGGSPHGSTTYNLANVGGASFWGGGGGDSWTGAYGAGGGGSSGFGAGFKGVCYVIEFKEA